MAERPESAASLHLAASSTVGERLTARSFDDAHRKHFRRRCLLHGVADGRRARAEDTVLEIMTRTAPDGLAGSRSLLLSSTRPGTDCSYRRLLHLRAKNAAFQPMHGACDIFDAPSYSKFVETTFRRGLERVLLVHSRHRLGTCLGRLDSPAPARACLRLLAG
eukprot:scaffold837_cov255-Pinguiococcus_pyrenoidosus.AAC.3